MGQSLGSEHELTNRYGVSRAVLREAVRVLESHGVAEMRLGRGGGLRVSAPRADAAVDSFDLVLSYRGATVEDLIEATGVLDAARRPELDAEAQNVALELFAEILARLAASAVTGDSRVPVRPLGRGAC